MRVERKGFNKKLMNQLRGFNAKVETQEDGTVKATTTVAGEKFEAVGPSNSNVMDALHQQIVEKYRSGGLREATVSEWEKSREASE